VYDGSCLKRALYAEVGQGAQHPRQIQKRSEPQALNRGRLSLVEALLIDSTPYRQASCAGHVPFRQGWSAISGSSPCWSVHLPH
jgi:hypothetical protein